MKNGSTWGSARTVPAQRQPPVAVRVPVARTAAHDVLTAPYGQRPALGHDAGLDAATRNAVLERDGYACVCCGRTIIGQPYTLHPRKRHSQGGDTSPSNLVTVLDAGRAGCRARIDSGCDPSDEAKGYVVRSWDDPALTPVVVSGRHGTGCLVWLTPDGSYRTQPPGRDRLTAETTAALATTAHA
jgi:hypothetical protein